MPNPKDVYDAGRVGASAITAEESLPAESVWTSSRIPFKMA